jgi:Lon protease-like protein
MRIALFPLPIFLLPGGKTRLTIFEPRYKRLVSESMETSNGFGLCLPSEDINTDKKIGTRVEIFDFDMSEDGLLTIDIQGLDRFEFNNVDIENDGLKHAKVTLLSAWQDIKIDEESDFLSQSLEKVLDLHPLYEQKELNTELDNLTWVCQRWLEILPIAIDKKYLITRQHDFQPVINFVNEIINKESKK